MLYHTHFQSHCKEPSKSCISRSKKAVGMVISLETLYLLNILVKGIEIFGSELATGSTPVTYTNTCLHQISLLPSFFLFQSCSHFSVTWLFFFYLPFSEGSPVAGTELMRSKVFALLSLMTMPEIVLGQRTSLVQS